MAFSLLGTVMIQDTLITLSKISAHYDRILALEGITANFKRGSLTAVIGPNGAGKSTLLKIINGVIPLSRGKLILHEVTAADMAYLPQRSQIDRTFPITVFDVVAMGLWQHIGPFKAYPDQATEQVLGALKDVGMEKYIHRPIAALSGGQFQRILFARLSLQKAKLILLDEPFNNLDESTVQELMQIILKWHSRGQTIVVVLHDLDLVKSYFPHCLLLARQLVTYGLTAKVLTVDQVNEAYRLMRHFSKDSDHE